MLIKGEYFLGYFDSTKQDPDYFKQNNDKLIPSIAWKNLNGVKIPTYAVKYTDGTLCEILKDTKREITIFYGIHFKISMKKKLLFNNFCSLR